MEGALKIKEMCYLHAEGETYLQYTADVTNLVLKKSEVILYSHIPQVTVVVH